MNNTSPKTQVITMVRTKDEEKQAVLMIRSLRHFGGTISNSPVLVYYPRGYNPILISIAFNDPDDSSIKLQPFDIAGQIQEYYFSDKVSAFANAEKIVQSNMDTLIWMNPGCLVVNQSDLFVTDGDYLAAFRPVHIQNVGSFANSPSDDYWKGIYRAVGLKNSPFNIESFVDSKLLKPYFNTHCFSLSPHLGIGNLWLEVFDELVTDQYFQQAACQDDLHQVFLHQAVLSAVVIRWLDNEKIRILPPSYSYPLHFQDRIKPSKRVKTLNELTCAVYEESSDLDKITIQEPYKSWLERNTP